MTHKGLIMTLFNNTQVLQFDNITSRVADDLMLQIKKNSKIAIAAACFSIYAYDALKKQLDDIDELRFIFTSPAFINQNNQKEHMEFYIPRMEREQSLYGTEFELKLRNKLTQKAISKECAEWVRQKVQFKSNKTSRPMQSFVNVGNKYTYIGINGFTTTDLGVEKGNSLGGFVNRVESEASRKYLQMFDEVWNDPEQMEDVKAKVLENIETVYAENSPEFIYMVTLYNIFKEFLNNLSDDVMPNDAVGFKESQIWKMLFAFQKDAAIDIIHKLEKYNGCILADSVGLGKTFTALAVIKYYENRNKSVLVLCPKKLQNNWMTYKSHYTNNPLIKDRLRYDVLYHTDLSRENGFSNGLDLSLINWNTYDLLVIDESHNFRNGGQTTIDDEGLEHYNRYNQLMEKVIKTGVKTKVLMLSATPVNNRFVDLKYQLELAYEGAEDQINEKLDTKKSLSQIFNGAQRAFNAWSKLDTKERTAERLLCMLDQDFFTVLDAVTIARSRKHIEKSYNTDEIGKFPDRLEPINKYPAITSDVSVDLKYKDLANQLYTLNLSVYAPSSYILPSRLDKYEKLYGKKKGNRGISLKGRELGTVKLMGINLLKRLESSWYAFKLTAESIQEKINKSVAIVQKYEKNRSGSIDVIGLNDEDAAEQGLIGEQYQIDLKDMDYKTWLADLLADQATFNEILNKFAGMSPQNDNKLHELQKLISNKIEHPINPGNKKILIFTEWADTAKYLYEQLSSYVKNKFGLDTALITGDAGTSKTTINHDRKVKMDFNMIMTLFSPISKDRDKLNDAPNGNIDILIGTDCISEGQNLQDCDFMVNFDIHWNPVRIVQRFGRIDRIGSKNDKIQMVNFWPENDLDEYIDLTNRVQNRMVGVAIAGTGTNIIGKDTDLAYRREQLEKIQKESPDLEDMNTGVNIMDLGLNEFRMEIVEYLKSHPEVEKSARGMHTIVPATPDMPAGTIFVLRNVNNGERIDKQNRLHPFYMVYLAENGEVICDHLSPKKMLDFMRRLCKGHDAPYKALCKRFNSETKDGFEMAHYSDMLSKSIQSIIQVKEESDINSLFSFDGGGLLTNTIQGLDDFELISFIVVK